MRMVSQQTQDICITFIQRRPNVFDVGPTLYKCYTNVLCLLGWRWARAPASVSSALQNQKALTAHLPNKQLLPVDACSAEPVYLARMIDSTLFCLLHLTPIPNQNIEIYLLHPISDDTSAMSKRWKTGQSWADVAASGPPLSQRCTTSFICGITPRCMAWWRMLALSWLLLLHQ